MACDSNATRRLGVRRVFPWMVMVLGVMPMASYGETISVVTDEEVQAGEAFSALVLISDAVESLVGYTVSVRVVPQDGATGTITRDVASSNFFEAQNLIEQGGDTLDPNLSVIGPGTGGAVFFNALTASLNPVPPAVVGVSDALAQAWFNVSEDASGDFEIVLGSSTVLLDGNSNPVPFDFETVKITVVPEPMTVLLAATGFVAMLLRRRVR